MSLFKKIGAEEIVEFANSFSVMLKSGMAVNEALKTLSDQTDNKTFKQVLNGVQTKVQAGIPMSEAFSYEEKYFGSVFISLVKVGESSGTMDESLTYVAEWLGRENALHKEINAATTYPKFVFGATLLMGAGLALYILPKLVPLFSQLRVKLPLPTQILLAFTAFVQNYWYVVIIIVVAVYFSGKALLKIRSVKRFAHTLAIKLPFVGTLISDYQLALVTRLFETLLKSGLSLRETISITSESVTNVNYEESLIEINERVKGGTQLSIAMADYPKLYPKSVVNIVATGEKSGTIDTSLGYLADYYIKEVQSKTKQLPTILEPALLIFIGVVVGFVAFSIIMPIYSLTSGVSQ